MSVALLHTNLRRKAATLLTKQPPILTFINPNALRDSPTPYCSQLLLASASALATGPDEKAANRKSFFLPSYNNQNTAAKMTPEYKEEKRSSVTDLQGGGIWEINILTFLAPVCSPTFTRNRI